MGQLKDSLSEILCSASLAVRCRDGEEVLLHDVTLTDVKEALQVDIDIVKSSGQDFVEAIRNQIEGEKEYE